MGNNRLVRLLNTSIGRKLVMAVTGLALIGFLVGHLLGNLTVFRGEGPMNAYAEWLQNLHLLLWVARAGLLGVFGVHIYLALQLSRENRQARPVRYRHPQAHETSSPASRTMLLTGALILTFVVLHLLHFTWGVLDPGNTNRLDAAGRTDVFNMVLTSFQNPLIAWGYVGFMLLLGVHLIHGAISLVQTLGLNHETYDRAVRLLVGVLVGLLVLGFSVIPIAVQVGFLTPTGA